MIAINIRSRYDIAYAEKDRMITKLVPYISAAAAAVGLLLIIIGQSGEMASLLLRFCAPFVVAYAFLGIYAFMHRDVSAIDDRLTLLTVLLIVPLVISVAMIIATSYVMPEVIDYLMDMVGEWASKGVAVFIAIYSLTILMMFMSHGVISTVVAYFRRYTVRIYLSLEKIRNDRTDTPRNKISKWIYCVPEVIDVQRIELEPSPDKRFPTRMFVSMAFSIFAIGLSISSYIFLNPIFQSTLTIDEAVMITAILTFFMPVLVIPWFITRDIGAKIKSQARDYYLWKGMRRRLYQGFFAIMVLLSMFAISLYFGYDIVRTSYTYAGYVLITAFLSFFYAFIYSNYYHKGFKEGIVKEFAEAKRTETEAVPRDPPQ